MASRSRPKLSSFKILWAVPGVSPGGRIYKCSKRPSIINYAKTLGAIITSVHDLASNRSVYPAEVDGNFIVAQVSTNFV